MVGGISRGKISANFIMTRRTEAEFGRGDMFGSRVLTSEGYRFSKRIRYNFKCIDCGLEGTMTQPMLKQSITCCGGIYRRGRDRLRVVWDDMHSRCYDPKHPQNSHYRSRGITVAGWSSYADFKVWSLENGYRYGLDLDRTDNDKGYSPENCNFVTRQDNANNRTSNRWLTHDGRRLTLEQWSRETGIKSITIAARIDRYGWPVNKALTVRVR